jgi:hypothetical protein
VFYTLMQDRVLPDHCRVEWVEPMYEAHDMDLHTIIEAFRGGTKTTTIAETFQALRIGNNPEQSSLLIQADDTKARKHAKNAADMIGYNPMWKLLFPHVVPDESRGWGAEGYWVKDTRIDYGNWVRKRHQDPTLVGAGIFDSFITGMHPTGLLDLDDINNDKNTESERENERVNRLLGETIFPASEDVNWHIFCQTPWTERDALAIAKATGVYEHVKTPVFRDIDPAHEDAQYFEPMDRWVNLTWPEKFNITRTANQYAKSGAVGFARMYLLDLEAAKGHNLKREWIFTYPHEDIDENQWPVFMGLDYASSMDKLKYKDRDYFVLCWGYVNPQGQLIMVDGIREHLSQAEAEQRTVALASVFPRLQVMGVESIGTGQEFVQLIQRADVFLPILPIPAHKGQARSKGGRFEKVLAPMFQRREMMISDKMTPFLKEFINEWVSWDGGKSQGHDDTLDGAYMMARAAEGIISIPKMQMDASESPIYKTNRRRPTSAFAAWGKQMREDRALSRDRDLSDRERLRAP